MYSYVLCCIPRHPDAFLYNIGFPIGKLGIQKVSVGSTYDLDGIPLGFPWGFSLGFPLACPLGFPWGFSVGFPLGFLSGSHVMPMGFAQNSLGFPQDSQKDALRVRVGVA